MAAQRLGMSQLARDAGFGTRIWSEFGYWGGRLYNLIVAFGTAVILIASMFGQVSGQFITLCLMCYALYLLVRFSLIKQRETTFYQPLPQFLRAQVSIIVLTAIIASVGESGTRGYLWLLFTLQLMIISRHMDTWLFGLSVLQVCLILTGLRLSVVPVENIDTFIRTNLDLVVQWTWIALIGFVIHYLLRNIQARDETIGIMSRINSLADRRQTDPDQKARWETVLEIYLQNAGARCGSVWIYHQHESQIRPLTNLDCCLDSACRSTAGDIAMVGSTSLEPDHPVIEAARSGRPIYCRSRTKLEDHLSRLHRNVRVCALPKNIQGRILMPILEPDQTDGEVLGVLCVDFDQANPVREHLLEHYFEFFRNVTRQVVPILQFNRQIETQQTLYHLGTQVSSSLHLEQVLEDTLDALTGPMGFEIATISLVDEEAQLIRCLAGRNVPQAWIELAHHPLTGTDIQADIVRRGKPEVLKDWDDRFDRRLYKRFHHDQLIRAFVPILRRQSSIASSSDVQGVVEVGHYLRTQDRITSEQLTMLTTFIDQVALSIEQARLFEDTVRHRQLLAQLHQVSHDIAETREPTRVLANLGEALRKVLKADIVMIYCLNRSSQTIDPPQVFGEVWGRRRLQVPPPDRGIIAEILCKGDLYHAADAANDPLLSQPYPPLAEGEKAGARRTFTMRQNIKSFAGMPMSVNGDTVGVLCVNFRRRHAFSENEQHVLGLAAQLAAVALRNAERHVLSAELAVKEERHRLAGQLHDSVSQYVPAIQLMADTGLKVMWSQPDQTAHWLERIQDAAQQTMTEIRINLFETRVSTTRSRNLRQALLESAKLAHEYFGLEVDIAPKAVPKQLRIPIEAELLLICREAITNAARHSGAQRVTVELSEINGQVRLHVEDNGCGFDVEALSVQGLRGLELMRERVERMQGQLLIQSGLGEGTAIEATIPI